MHTLCANNCQNVAKFKCKNCLNVFYCSATCQAKHWQQSHINSCIFFIGPGVKRDKPSEAEQNDEAEKRKREKMDFSEMLQKYNEMSLEDRQEFQPTLTNEFGKLSKEDQERFIKFMPCVNQTDYFTLESFDEMEEKDNVVYIQEGSLKMCYNVDQLNIWLFSNKKNIINPGLNIPFSNVQMQIIKNAIKQREANLLKNLYMVKEPEEIIFKLVNNYHITPLEIDWDKLNLITLNKQYMAMPFNMLQEIDMCANMHRNFAEMVEKDDDFWYWIFKKLLPNVQQDLGAKYGNLLIKQQKNIQYFLSIDSRKFPQIKPEFGNIYDAYVRTFMTNYKPKSNYDFWTELTGIISINNEEEHIKEVEIIGRNFPFTKEDLHIFPINTVNVSISVEEIYFAPHFIHFTLMYNNDKIYAYKPLKPEEMLDYLFTKGGRKQLAERRKNPEKDMFGVNLKVWDTFNNVSYDFEVKQNKNIFYLILKFMHMITQYFNNVSNIELWKIVAKLT